MSSGGMEWAYRMVQQNRVDALGALIVFHLGWRDAPNCRTDRGIARALNRDRTTIKKATARLAQMGIIERRSNQWVACETVAIIEQRPDARVPDEYTGRGSEAPGGQRPPGEGARDPRKRGPETPPKRKEKKRERVHAPACEVQAARNAQDTARRQPERAAASEAAASREAARDVGELNDLQRTLIREGKGVLIAGQMVKPDTAIHDQWQAALKSVERWS